MFLKFQLRTFSQETSLSCKNDKQGMLVSIVSCFGNTWFLLCLEIPDADWLSGCVCLEVLHSDCFCCMWYLLCLEMLHSHWMSALLLQKRQHFCCPCILIGWVVCSTLEKKEASIFQMASNSFCNIRNKFITELFEEIYLKININLG